VVTMASIFLSGLGWVVLQACFVGWVGSISYWVGLGWITKNGPMSMSERNYVDRGQRVTTKPNRQPNIAITFGTVKLRVEW